MGDDEPPCEGCPDRPPTLAASNALAWRVWSLLNEFDRPFASGMAVFPLPISARAMLEMTAAMDGSEEDFDRVCAFERVMFPFIQESYKSDK
jgi:hypothetical protein